LGVPQPPTSAYNPGTLLPLDIPLAPPTSTPVIMPTTTVPRLTPDVTTDPGWEQLLRETFAPKYKAPVVTPVLSPMEATPSSRLSPPAAAAPLKDPVSMLDQPELTPEWEAYLKQSTPLDIWDQKEKGAQFNIWEELLRPRRIHPSRPRTALPTSRRPRCLMPQPVYRPPSHYHLPPPLLRKLTCVFSKFLGKGVM